MNHSTKKICNMSSGTLHSPKVPFKIYQVKSSFWCAQKRTASAILCPGDLFQNIMRNDNHTNLWQFLCQFCCRCINGINLIFLFSWINWPDINQQLPAAVRDHAQKQSVNQTMTNPSGAGDLHNLRMTGPNHPPRQSVSPLTRHHNRWKCCSDWTYTRLLFSVGLGKTTIPSWNLPKQFSVILRT